MARSPATSSQGSLFGPLDAPKASRRLAEPVCELCPAVGSFGFFAPAEFMPAPTSGRFYCGKHKAQGEATWRETYGRAGR